MQNQHLHLTHKQGTIIQNPIHTNLTTDQN